MIDSFSYIFLSLGSIAVLTGIITIIFGQNLAITEIEKIFMFFIYWFFFIICGLGQLFAVLKVINKDIFGFVDLFLRWALLGHSVLYILLFLVSYKYVSDYISFPGQR